MATNRLDEIEHQFTVGYPHCASCGNNIRALTREQTEWLIEEVKRLEGALKALRNVNWQALAQRDQALAEAAGLRATLKAHIEIIAMTHANGYGHWNPWQDCDHQTCTAARDLRTGKQA
jgi:hypothetical protein